MKRLLTALAALVLVCSSAFGADRREIPGGWYGENLPTGEYAVAVPTAHKLVTHRGDVAFGPDEPLYVRVTNKTGFRLAGQGHNTGQTVEWTPAEGWTVKPSACGVSPVIYDLAGILHISDCSIGSQGWRYVADDGTLVTGDQTYASGTLGLYEFTTRGDISIGQGGNGGAIAVTAAGRFVLEPGHTTFVRFNRDGSHLAVTIVKLLEAKTVLLWLDASEIASFPREVVDAPPPPPAPAPVPVPVPDSLIAPNRMDVVAAVIADHPEINACDEVERGAIVDYAAQRLNAAEGKVIWGRKSRNPEGTDLNTDGLTFKRPDGRFEIYDSVGGGSCKATWDGFGPFAQGKNGYWVAPVLAPESGQHTPPPVSNDSQLPARIAELEAAIQAANASNKAANLRIVELEAERDDLKGQLATTQAERDALLNKPAPTCVARVETPWARSLGARASCTVK